MMPALSRSLLRVLALGMVLGSALAPGSEARVEITLDAATLTEFLSVVTPPTVLVPLPSGREIALELGGVRVNGFDPAAGRGGRGQVLTSLNLSIPALGLRFPLEPRVSLEVLEEKGEKVCVLRFEKMDVPLPVTGTLDVSVFIPPLRIPAEADWTLPVRQRDVHVKSRLVEARMGSEALRLAFDLDMAPEGSGAGKRAGAGS